MNILESIQYVLESAQSDANMRAKQAGYTKTDVGSGYGKLAGGVALGLPGIVAGHYLGKNMVNSPEKTADLTKKSHRFGIAMSKAYQLKHLKHAVLGALVGGAGGALGGDIIGDEPGAAAGAATGAAIGSLAGPVSQITSQYRNAKRMGYGGLGRAGNILVGPLASLTTPKSQIQSK